MKNHQVIIGIDYGTKRTGLAIGQTYLQTAQAIKPINTINSLPDDNALKKILAEWQPNFAVIGKPASASKGFIKKLNRVAHYLKEQYQLDSCFIDETLTTEQANYEMHFETLNYINLPFANLEFLWSTIQLNLCLVFGEKPRIIALQSKLRFTQKN